MRAFLVTLLLCLCVGAARAESGLPRRSEAKAGIASVYAYGSHTANGERFDPHALTAAHRRLPFGTMVKVCRPPSLRYGATRAQRCIVVRINDRGPFVRGRIIDLTPAGAHALGFSGLARVTVEPIGWTPQHGDFGSF